MNKILYRYITILGQRIYRPVKPLTDPLLKKLKLSYLLYLLLLTAVVSVGSQGWKITAIEKMARWPWSAKSRAEMAIAWFEAGNEVNALEELKIANKLTIFKTKRVNDFLKKAEDKVKEPERIKEEILKWEKILETRPYDKEILIRLSLLNFKLYKGIEAKEYWERAYYLDPNYQEVQKAGKIIFSLP